MVAPLYGLVLAGGKSSRMGRDKGLIEFHGKPQREFLFDLLGRFCERVYTSAYRGQEVPVRLNPIIDMYDLGSPLNGILTAFEKFPDVAWLIIAVDMPRVNENVIADLIRHRKPEKIATCFFHITENFPEPLLTVWEPAAHIELLKFVAQGSISPRDFLHRHAVELVYPADDSIFLNVNSPDELPR
jgi:molybdenum cofactor guanylyltransferase